MPKKNKNKKTVKPSVDFFNTSAPVVEEAPVVVAPVVETPVVVAPVVETPVVVAPVVVAPVVVSGGLSLRGLSLR